MIALGREDKTHLNPGWTGRERSLVTLREPIWERQPRERARDFQAFQSYRDLPPSQRSIRKVAETDGRAERTLESISRRWRWVDRAAELDGERDRNRRIAEQEAVLEMNDRHARSVKQMLTLLAQPANALARKLAGEGMAALENMPVSELLKLVMQGGKLQTDLMRMERLARGEADHSVEVHETGAGPTARAIMQNPEAVRQVHELLQSRLSDGPVVEARVVPPELPAPASEEEPPDEDETADVAEDDDLGFLNGASDD